ncbi:hypothetical protein [Achromobacter kerstersii]|uniref:hypothetical protein n=1 Tax=Achromobacter kerstersii TaxID=1353890 RepID=UPI003D06B4E4
MTRYVRIVDGVTVEIIEPRFDDSGKEIAIDQRYHPDFVALLVEEADIAVPPRDAEDEVAEGEDPVS